MNLVPTRDDDLLARREPGLDHHVVSFRRAHGDRTKCYALFGPAHHVNQRPAGRALHGGDRHQRRPASDVDEQPSVHELVGKELVVFIGEDRLQLDGPGRRI